MPAQIWAYAACEKLNRLMYLARGESSMTFAKPIRRLCYVCHMFATVLLKVAVVDGTVLADFFESKASNQAPVVAYS